MLPTLQFGPFLLAGPQGPFYHQDAEVKLPPKAVAVMWFLASHAGQVVSKTALLENVWAGTAVGEDALGFQIRLLRRALDDDARHPRYIRTVHRIGYRFVAPVSTGPSGPRPQTRSSRAASQIGPPSGHQFVGRDTDLAQLHDALTRSLSGERQMVFVTGEAGIGKTALVEKFLTRTVGVHPVRIGRGQCVEPFGAGEPYLPLLEALRQMCCHPDGERVVHILQQHAPSCLVQMPTLVTEDTFEVLERSIRGMTRNRMVREAAEGLEAIARDQPVVLWLEDLHWSDPSTVELLAMVARRQEPVPLLVILTHRPIDLILTNHPLTVIKQELVGRGHAIEVPLACLDADVVRAFVRLHLEEGIQDTVSAFVHRYTDGHPLFMVHMTAYLAQQHDLQRAVRDGEQTFIALEQVLPQRLQELIEAQLGRLEADEQRLLEIASVDGAEFTVTSVAAAAHRPADAVEVMCERLAQRKQFIEDRGLVRWPDGSVGGRYGFRHVLYQQVLAGRLGAGRLARLHRAIGTRKAAGYGTRAGEIAAELALHFERGEDVRQAVHFYRLAAEKALPRHAYAESLAAAQRGLDLLQQEPAGADGIREELLLQLTQGAAFLATKGFSAPEVELAYTRAYALSQKLDEEPSLVPALYGLWNFSLTKGDLARARALADQLLALADRQPDVINLLPAYNADGWTGFFSGAAAATHSSIERSVALYDMNEHRTLASVYGEDQGVTGHMCAALTRWWLGYPSAAKHHLDRGLELAHSLAHPFGIAQMLWAKAVICQQLGHIEEVLDATRRLITLCLDKDFALWLAGGRVLHGWAVAGQGKVGQGIETIRQAMADWQSIGATTTRPYMLALLAMAHAKAGQRTEALNALEEAADTARRTGERWFDAEIARLRGMLMLNGQHASSRSRASVADAAAEQCLLDAIEIAQSQQAKSLELRAALCLAELPLARARRKEAHRALADIYAWFRDSDETPNLNAAAAFLEQ